VNQKTYTVTRITDGWFLEIRQNGAISIHDFVDPPRNGRFQGEREAYSLTQLFDYLRASEGLPKIYFEIPREGYHEHTPV
jgi:hypothetical protein